MQRWYRRAHDPDQDGFDRFFAIWVCLIVAAARFCSETGRCRRDKGERTEIVRYFSSHPAIVARALESRSMETHWLAERRGPSGGAVVDMVGLDDPQPERRERWRRHWLGESVLDEEEAARLFAHVAYDIRNNVFHGQKLYDDTEDREVVEHLWPVLATVLADLERPTLDWGHPPDS